MKENNKARRTLTAEIVVIPQVEDVERITWANSNRRRMEELKAARMAWQQAQETERLRKLRVLRIGGAAACVLFFVIGALTAFRAGVWAGLPAWLLGGLSLSVTGW